MIKAGISLLSAVVLAVTASGCSSGKSKDEYAWSDEDKVTLTVWTQDEAYFKQEYGVAFAVKHPNVTFRYAIPDPERPDRWQDDMEEAKPDIVVLDEEQYSQLTAQAELVDLEARYAQSGESLPQMVPAAEQLLRKFGDGKLFGVSPKLRSTALFYNRTIFEQYGVPLPQGQLTWTDLYRLAARFTAAEGSGIVGYAPEQSSTWDQLARWGQSEGLSLLTPDRKKLLLGTGSWKPIYEQLVAAMRSGAVYMLPLAESNPKAVFIDHPFVGGKAALMLGNASYGNSLTNARFEWGVVNAPVGTSLPNANPDYGLSDIVAIRTDSSNKGAAWAFITFVAGQEWPQSYAASRPYITISNPAYAVQEDKAGRSLAPFYALEPAAAAAGAPELSDEMKSKLAAIVENETAKAARNEQSVEDAIQAIVTSGESVLLQAAQS